MRSKGAPAGARQASPRVLAIAAVVVLMIGVGIALGVIFGTKSNNSAKVDPNIPKTGSATWKGALQGSTDVRKLFKGIPEQGLVLGSPTAPAQLTEFIDLQCPVCQAFETQQLPTLIQKYVRPGKLSIKMEPWDILDRGGHDSARGQAATIAASLQNKAFPFAEMLYLNQGTEDTGWLTDNMVQLAAASVDGVNVPRVLNDASSSGVKSVVNDVDTRAQTAGFNSTPTLLLASHGKSAHEVANSLPDLNTLESQIDSAIAG